MGVVLSEPQGDESLATLHLSDSGRALGERMRGAFLDGVVAVGGTGCSLRRFIAPDWSQTGWEAA